MEVSEVIVKGVEIKPDPNTFLKDIDFTLLLKNESIRSLQTQGGKINSILERLQNDDVDSNLYMVEDGILRQRIIEPTGNEFKPIVIPKCMVDHVLLTAHDHNGHNGFPRTYASVRCLYFWVGMKKRHTQTL